MRLFPLPPGEAVIGRAAIAKLTQEYFDAGVSEFTEETLDLYASGALLIDHGRYSMVDGKWRIYSDIWNSVR